MITAIVKKSSFGLKILFPTILITALVFIFFTFFLINDQRKRSDTILQYEADTITVLLANSITEPLWAFDLISLEKVVASFFKTQSIYELKILDENLNNILVNLKKSFMGNKKLIKEVNIKKNDEIIGRIHIVYTNYYAEQNLKQIKNNRFIRLIDTWPYGYP